MYQSRNVFCLRARSHGLLGCLMAVSVTSVTSPEIQTLHVFLNEINDVTCVTSVTSKNKHVQAEIEPKSGPYRIFSHAYYYFLTLHTLQTYTRLAG